MLQSEPIPADDPDPSAQLRASLPGRYYTDPAQFTRDQEAVFARSWLCVARSEDVAQRGGSCDSPPPAAT
jgi:Rieske 2Fe-2S family protein